MKKVQPEDLYTIGPSPTRSYISSIVKKGEKIEIECYFETYNYNRSREWNAHIEKDESGKYYIASQATSTRISIFLQDNPKYLGFFYADISGSPQTIFCCFNNNKELIPITIADYRVESTLGVTVDCSTPFYHRSFSDVEQKYYEGLTEVRTHISKEEYDRLIEESNASSNP